jgi:hypothetical protein
MTFPGASVREWMVACGSDLAQGRSVPAVANMTYHRVLRPKTNELFDLRSPLFFGIRWPTERSGVGNKAMVFVQSIQDAIYVSLHERIDN